MISEQVLDFIFSLIGIFCLYYFIRRAAVKAAEAYLFRKDYERLEKRLISIANCLFFVILNILSIGVWI